MLLVGLLHINVLEPPRTAQAITPLLLELPPEAVHPIADELDTMLDSPEPGLRSAAVALKVRSGASMNKLAERDPQALLDAVRTLPEGQVPASVADELIALAGDGLLPADDAMKLAVGLNDDRASLFEQLAAYVEKAQAISYTQWGEVHRVGMAALASMHAVPDDQWPEGYDPYRIERADPAVYTLGETVYHDELSNGCYKCHGKHGEGMENMPPLAGSQWVLGDPHRPAAIVKHGMAGEMPGMINPLDGKPYNAAMEAQAQYNETQVAAVLTYIRQSWGNFAAPVTPQQVLAAKGPGGGKWEPRALLAEYPFERDRLMGPLPAPPPPQVEVVPWSAPGVGVVVMLVVVAAMLGVILVMTWLGGGPPRNQHTHGTPAMA
ncbi:MAG: c-type cytochrome [Phycisphaeraceae bacterium]